MLITKVYKLLKNGTMKTIFKTRMKDNKENALELEKLAEIAEDCYVDEAMKWK